MREGFSGLPLRFKGGHYNYASGHLHMWPTIQSVLVDEDWDMYAISRKGFISGSVSPRR